MKTAYILVRHLDTKYGIDVLDVGGGRFERLTQDSKGRTLFGRCKELFPGALPLYGDWLYQKQYSTTPPARLGSDPSGTGDIPFETEDLLLALRLLQPGDISFVSQALDDEGTLRIQERYRYFGDINTTHPFQFDPSQVSEVEKLLQLVRTPTVQSAWFAVAKRFFLYGGAKEFNPYVGELDRIIDFVIALEAVLVFEHDLVSRRLRRRATTLLGLSGTDADVVSRLFRDFYGHRSTIAHGDPIKIVDAAQFHREMEAFETAVRSVLKEALRLIPGEDNSRRAALVGLGTVTDAERLEFLVSVARGLEDLDKRQKAIESLQSV